MCAVTLVLAAASVQADDNLESAIGKDLPYLHNLYTFLHSHPELSSQERETAKRLAEELQQEGFVVTEGVGGYGVVAILRNGKGPTVLLRTDMDALPIKETTGLPYASTRFNVNEDGTRVPVMHACGHDIHMTVFIGAARRMAALKDRWSGTLMMVAQPAEEIGNGARQMLQDGLYRRFARPDFNLALHLQPQLPAGTLAVPAGYSFANVDSVDIDVRGIGGHGANPEAAKDPVVLAAQIVLALQTIVSREVSPLEPAVVTVGTIHGGEQRNIIPELVKLQLTVRSYSDETRNTILDAIQRIARDQALSAGMPEEKLPVVWIKKDYTPALYNDPALTERVRDLLAQRLGEARLRQQPPVMIGEDFALYGRVKPPIPSLMFWLGAGEPAAAPDTSPPLHSPRFAPPPDITIRTGVTAMTEAALLLLGGDN